MENFRISVTFRAFLFIYENTLEIHDEYGDYNRLVILSHSFLLLSHLCKCILWTKMHLQGCDNNKKWCDNIISLTIYRIQLIQTDNTSN